jgi:nickel-dependent lactate racemase
MSIEKTLLSVGGADVDLTDGDLRELFSGVVDTVSTQFPGKVLLVPPDSTRFHSRAGFLTGVAVERLGAALGAVLPATGTHRAMTAEEIAGMFPGVPPEKFAAHNWRDDAVTLGHVDGAFVSAISDGRLSFDWPVQVNRAVSQGGYGLVVSLGQVVPHEVAGMANHTKNLFVGLGGKEAIDKSHFLGAVCGMEQCMGRVDTPVRKLFDEGFRRYGDALPPVLFVLTVVGPRSDGTQAPVQSSAKASDWTVRGLFAGFGRECFKQAAALAETVNIHTLTEPVQKAYVYLDPQEYRSTWLGNKAIYRMRMAMADGGELVVLAPGLERFGEDPVNDRLIRKYGYRPAAEVLSLVERSTDLQENLSAAAHLIHGSPEGRFTVRYCPGKQVSRGEIESVGYRWGDLEEEMKKCGSNTASDKTAFYIRNPALGLWKYKGVYT